MDKHSSGIISFYEVAEIINNAQGDYNELINGLINYFKTLSNTDFNEEQFREECLKK